VIAIFCPFHNRPDLAYEQLVNYRNFFQGNAHFFLHISIEARRTTLDKYQMIEKEFDNVEIVPDSFQTSPNCVFGAFLSCSKHLFDKYNKSDFSHVFLHTDADLLFRKGIYEYILDKNIAFSKKPTRGSEHTRWAHAKKMYTDQTFMNFLQKNGVSIESILLGRQEGSFFPIDLWLEIFSLAKEFQPWDEYFLATENWPLEEVFIPTACKRILGFDNNSENVIKTVAIDIDGNKKSKITSISEAEIIIFNKHSHYFGLKRFPLDVNHSVRKYLRENILNLDSENLVFPWLKYLFFFENLDKKINKQDQSADILREVAVSFEKSGDIQTALAIMKKALEIRPNGSFIKKKVTEYTIKLDI
jgi:hypothetical protein